MTPPDDAPSPPADGLVGQLWMGRYRIDARLGEGGMGAVYRAHHTGLGSAIAVKVLHPELTADPELASRFDREALALSKLDHPNCLRVLDAGTSPSGAKYIVMPLLDGQELRAHLGAPLPIPRVLDLTIQILRGLEHAHRRGMIHRDLKPENVLVVHDDDGREVAKLVDFGIVKLLVDDPAAAPLTRVGLVFGTPRYMSPEQVGGGKVTERTDLYALGIILFEMLTGNAPFEADDAGMLMRMQILGDVPALPDGVPAGIAAVVQRLLEKSPADRFGSAREVREALESAMVAAPGRTVLAASGTDPLGATIVAASVPATVPPPPPPATAQAPVVMTMPAEPIVAVAAPPPARARSLRGLAPIAAAIVLALLGVTILASMGPEERDAPASAMPTATIGTPVSPTATPTPTTTPAAADATAREPSARRDDASVPTAPAKTHARPATSDGRVRDRDSPRPPPAKAHGKGHGKGKHKGKHK